MNRKATRLGAVAAAVGLSIGVVAGCSSNDSASSPSAGTTQTTSVTGADQTAARPNPYAFLPKVPSFTLTSQTVENGKPLPTAQLSGVFKVPGGQDISPQLSWSGFPAETKSFVVSMYDPEAPTGSGFWHWIVADLPATTTSLAQDAGTLNSKILPAGAIQLRGDAGAARYIGGAPPSGSGVHDYYLTVSALKVDKSGIDATASGSLLGFTIGGNTIARATLVWPTAAS